MFRVEIHDNSYEYFSKIDLEENAFHITSNLSLEKLIKENNKNPSYVWKVKNITHLLENIYPNLHDLLNNNRLKIDLRDILIKNEVHESLMKEENIKILFSDYIFLIQSGIRQIPTIENISKEQEVIINIFNQFVQKGSVQEIIKELSSAANLKNKYTEVINENIKTIYLYNFNNLYLSRMVFFTRLKYLGYEVVFRIPQLNIENIDEPWKKLYSKKYFMWDESKYIKYNPLEKSTYTDYIQGLEVKDDNKDIVFKEFLGSFEFKNELKHNKDKSISYYALDTNLINQVFDIDEEKEQHMPLIKFMTNIYTPKFKDSDIYLNYSLLTELLTSGWIEIKEGNRIINGIDHLDFIKNLESYFEGLEDIESILNRIEDLRNLKLASDTMENKVKQKIIKNKVKRYLSNPFRCISYVNVENYDITIVQFKSLIERLRYILRNILKREDEFVEYNKNTIFLKSILEKNIFINELREDEEYKPIIDKIYKALEYKHDIDIIYKEDVKELTRILLSKNSEEETHKVLPIDTIDGDWQRKVYDEIHITDLSFKSYQKYLESRKTIGKYINHKFINKILNTNMYKDKEELKKCLEIAKLSVNNTEQFFSFDISNLIVNYKGKIVLSYIQNLRDGDSESILLRVLKNLYQREHNIENTLLDYLDNIEIEENKKEPLIITNDILNKHRVISPVGYRDLDFCYTKFIYSNILESNVIYESDFHHKLLFSTIISLLKRDIPNYEDNIKRFLFPLFPQWNETTKENMVMTNLKNLQLKEYYLYENINFPKNIDRLQILMSKYIVTEKYKVKNRYEENKLDTEKLFKEFSTNYLNNNELYNPGRHCTMCPHILICDKGEYPVERDN
ncbi:hypothetical protein [Romboutsia hominis]|uniref:Uncharacterized protein n=1 Tax=Romboutsia hominis TaxID=1507512 RepID=A0A2P2BQH1_9FIRM|nr:hypothetical protein [Romboutsia hominis]CEI72577.1 Hypothetical protein FRIFI_1037 [Romboutsia hominis]